jgi:hypothetical protein
MTIDYSLANRQSDASTGILLGGMQSLKHQKYAVKKFLCYANAIVLNRE